MMNVNLRKGYEVVNGIVTFPLGTKVEWIYPEVTRLLVLTNVGVTSIDRNDVERPEQPNPFLTRPKLGVDQYREP